jgi:hypothetical protein
MRARQPWPLAVVRPKQPGSMLARQAQATRCPLVRARRAAGATTARVRAQTDARLALVRKVARGPGWRGQLGGRRGGPLSARGRRVQKTHRMHDPSQGGCGGWSTDWTGGSCSLLGACTGGPVSGAQHGPLGLRLGCFGQKTHELAGSHFADALFAFVGRRGLPRRAQAPAASRAKRSCPSFGPIVRPNRSCKKPQP